MTAVPNTPADIWAEVFDHLLYDSSIFQSDPFYPGCNPHTALRQWHDYTPIATARAQRKILRLVSKLWKEMVDSRKNWFFEGNSTSEAIVDSSKWKCARRIHLCVSPRRCRCHDVCSCISHDYYFNKGPITNEAHWPYDRFTAILQGIITTSPLPVQIMMLNAHAWQEIVKSLTVETAGRLFANVKALDILGLETSISRIPTFLKSLTYLCISMKLKRDDLSEDTREMIFPNLTTLRMRIPDPISFASVQTWKLPKLLHLEFRDLAATGRTYMHAIIDYLLQGWSIQTLHIFVDDTPIHFPASPWISLPKLQYFGSTALASAIDPPPPEHPLRTFALLEPNPSWMSQSMLMDSVHGSNVEVIASVHRWEDVVFDSERGVGQKAAFEHEHGIPLCHECVLDMHDWCQEHGFRYEDRWGRSLEEFKALSEHS